MNILHGTFLFSAHHICPLYYLQTAFEIFIAKRTQCLNGSVTPQKTYVRQRHTVKGVIFHCGINRHILKYQLVSPVQRMFQTIIANDVTGKTSRSAQPINIPRRLFLLTCLGIRFLDRLLCRGNTSVCSLFFHS